MLKLLSSRADEVRGLSAQFPEAREFLSFRSLVIQSRRETKSPHGHPTDWIQPHDTTPWAARTDTQYLAVANWLFWGTLFSQIVFTDYKDYYEGTSLKKHLLFPEVRGDCLSSCKYHLEPFDAVLQCLPSPSVRFVPDPSSVKLERDCSIWLAAISGKSLDSCPPEIADDIYAKCLGYEL
jgi:hypothetical protein